MMFWKKSKKTDTPQITAPQEPTITKSIPKTINVKPKETLEKKTIEIEQPETYEFDDVDEVIEIEKELDQNRQEQDKKQTYGSRRASPEFGTKSGVKRKPGYLRSLFMPTEKYNEVIRSK